jgi:hypothetical protein
MHSHADERSSAAASIGFHASLKAGLGIHVGREQLAPDGGPLFDDLEKGVEGLPKMSCCHLYVCLHHIGTTDEAAKPRIRSPGDRIRRGIVVRSCG